MPPEPDGKEHAQLQGDAEDDPQQQVESGHGNGGGSVEQFVPERFPAMVGVSVVVVSVMIVLMFRSPPMTAVLMAGVFPRRLGRPIIADAPLDDLVQFSAVKPNPAALRAIVDFDAEALGHQEIGGGTHRAFHFVAPELGEAACRPQ